MPITRLALTASRFFRWTLACAALALAACGGDGASAPPSTLDSVAGAWEDQTSARKTLAALILPSGAHWLFYRNSNDSSMGYEQGTASAAGNAFQARVMDYPNGFTARAVNVTAQIGTNSLTGTRAWTADRDSFALTPMPSASFDAQHNPQISDIAGNWTGTLSSASSSSAATFLLQSDGTFSGSNGGCGYRGALTPMSGVNAYQVSWNFVRNTCTFTTTSPTGLAMAYHPTSNSTQLFVAVQDDSRQRGWLFTATR